jgi:hypothetical protein
VVHEAVNRGRCRHRVLEDRFPLRERRIGGDQHTAALAAFREKREQDLHLVPALLYITQIVDDESFVISQFSNRAAQPQFFFSEQEILHQTGARGERHFPAGANQHFAVLPKPSGPQTILDLVNKALGSTLPAGPAPAHLAVEFPDLRAPFLPDNVSAAPDAFEAVSYRMASMTR